MEDRFTFAAVQVQAYKWICMYVYMTEHMDIVISIFKNILMDTCFNKILDNIKLSSIKSYNNTYEALKD